MSYADNTAVPVSRTREHIERILKRYGANRFAFATQPDCAMIGFQTNERRVRFVLPIPRSERQSHAKFAQRRRAEAIAVCKTAKISGH
jgi:hypothetical protein